MDRLRQLGGALRSRHTWDLKRNPHLWIGFAWGTGSLVLWLLFSLEQAPGLPRLVELRDRFLGDGVVHLLSLCPVVFAIGFGALGTLGRERRLRVEHALSLLSHEVDQRTSDLIGVRADAVLALSTAIEAKDPYTRGHCVRVWEYAKRAGLRMRLTDRELEELRFACYLHDVGKIHIPGHILNKNGSLTPRERDVVGLHPAYGERIVSRIAGFKNIARAVLHHHERCDGSGYPAGLGFEQIPLLSRIIAAADMLDALTSNRPYRTALALEAAINELRRCANLSFDASRVPGVDREGCDWLDPEVVECITEDLTELAVAEEQPPPRLEGERESGAPSRSGLESNLPDALAHATNPSKPNCWEFRRCGRERARPGERPACPAAVATHANGVNGGCNGGRICWAIVGSACPCCRPETGLPEPARDCAQCEFFHRVQVEEGLMGFVLLPEQRRMPKST